MAEWMDVYQRIGKWMGVNAYKYFIYKHNGWMNEYIFIRTHEWIYEWICISTHEWMNEWSFISTHGWMDEWVFISHMDGWMLMHSWMNKC